MSTTSRIVLAVSCTASVGTIAYVHYKQYADRVALRGGVIKDMERQEKRKAENLYYLQQQIELTKELQKQQYPDEHQGPQQISA